MKTMVYYCYIGNMPKTSSDKFVEERVNMMIEKFPSWKGRILCLPQREGSGDRVEVIDMDMPYVPPSPVWNPAYQPLTPPLYTTIGNPITGAGGGGGTMPGVGVSYGFTSVGGNSECVNCGADPIKGYVDTTDSILGTVGTTGASCPGAVGFAADVNHPLGPNVVDFAPNKNASGMSNACEQDEGA